MMDNRNQAAVNTLFGSIFGNVEQKYMKEEAVASSFDSSIALVGKKGNKIDFIRIANAIYELGMVEHKDGGKLTKQEYFSVLGKAFNVDLTGYAHDLSTSMNGSDYAKQTQIFDDLKKKHQAVYNSK